MNIVYKVLLQEVSLSRTPILLRESWRDCTQLYSNTSSLVHSTLCKGNVHNFMNGIFLKLSEVKRSPKQVFRKIRRGKLIKRKKKHNLKSLFPMGICTEPCQMLITALTCRMYIYFFPNKFSASVHIWLMGFCDMEVLQGPIVFISSCCPFKSILVYREVPQCN